MALLEYNNAKPWKQQYDLNSVDNGDITGWTASGNLPAKQYGAQVIVTKNRAYLLGGWNTMNAVYTAPIDDGGILGTWTTGTSLPGNAADPQVVVTKNRVYLLGGHAAAPSSVVYTAPIDDDGILGAWTTDESLPGPLYGSQAIVTKNRVYLLGGASTARVATVYTAPINEDGTLGTWTTGTSLPGAVYYSQAVVTKNRVYLLGGRTTAAVATVYTAPINEDGTLGTWAAGTSLPGALSGSQAIVTENRVYLLGGWNATASVATVYTAPIDEYGILGTWTTVTSLPGIIRFSQSIVTNSRVYLLGGYSAASTATVYVASFSGGLNDYLYKTFIYLSPPTTAIFSLASQLYDLEKYLIREQQEQLFSFLWVVFTDIEQIYGIKLAALLSQKWNDSPTIRQQLISWYGANPTHRRTWWQLYGNPLAVRNKLLQSLTDAPMLRTSLAELYDVSLGLIVALEQQYGYPQVLVTKSLQQYGNPQELKYGSVQVYGNPQINYSILDQPSISTVDFRKGYTFTCSIQQSIRNSVPVSYTISGADIRNTIPFEYSILNKDIICTSLNSYYSISTSITEYVQDMPTVYILGEELKYVSIDVDSSTDKFTITASLTLPSILEYSKCQLMQEIVIDINGTEITTVVINRSSNISHGKVAYSVELISPTITLDVPFSRTLSAIDNITADTLASEIITVLAAKNGTSIDYQLIDWLVKKELLSVVDESILEVIRKIANAIGGIVQTKPDGTLLLISRYPVSPTEWSTATPLLSISPDEIIELAENSDERTGHNAYIISDQGDSTPAGITIEAIDISSTTKIVKGYRVPFDAGEFPLLTSGGSEVTILKTSLPVEEQIPNSDSDSEWEIVEFIDWKGNTSKPIYEIVDIDWIEDELTDDAGIPSEAILNVDESGALSIMNTTGVPSESLLRIKYITKYWEWKVTGPKNKPVQLYVPELGD